jgi:hypothetical protein
MNSKDVFSSVIFVTFLVLVVFGVLQWLQIPKGTMIDWIIGIAAFWWLLGVVTLPWNMHFQAKEVLDDVRISREKELNVSETNVQYAQKIAKNYLLTAIVLHLISAAVLYVLAYLDISPIGYWGAILALLLTGLRPAVRMQAYIIQRLYTIRQEVLYPREDAYELRNKLEELRMQVESLVKELDKSSPDSFASVQLREIKSTRDSLKDVRVKLDNLDVQNRAEHERLAKKSEESLAKLGEDAQFLNQVRDLIRFVKSA